MVRLTAVLVGTFAASLAAAVSAAMAPTTVRTFYNSHDGGSLVLFKEHAAPVGAPVHGPGRSFVVQAHNPAPATTAAVMFGVVDETDASEVLAVALTPTPAAAPTEATAEATGEATSIVKVAPTAVGTAPVVVVVDEAEETMEPTPACVPKQVGDVFCPCVNDVLTCPPTPSPTPEVEVMAETATPAPTPACVPKEVGGVFCPCLNGVLTCPRTPTPTPTPTPEVVEVVEETVAPTLKPTPMPTPVVVEVVEETTAPAPMMTVTVDPVTIDVADGSGREKKDDGDMEVDLTTAPAPSPSVAPAMASATPTATTTVTDAAEVEMMTCGESCADQERKDLVACIDVATSNACADSIEYTASDQEADGSDVSDDSDAADAVMVGSASAIVAGMKIGEEPMGAFVGMGAATSIVTSCTSVTRMPHAMCQTKTMMKMCTAVMCMKPSVLTPAISSEELIMQVEAAIAGGPMPGMSVYTV